MRRRAGGGAVVGRGDAWGRGMGKDGGGGKGGRLRSERKMELRVGESRWGRWD